MALSKTHRMLLAAALCAAPVPTLAQDEHAHGEAERVTVADWARGAQLFDGLGVFRRPISTRSTEAQQYFDQGMRFVWAFNHDEATRSFAKAAEIDPACAICYWGVALTLGPNYNMPAMSEARAQVGWEALRRARDASTGGSSVEQALILALAVRYDGAKALDPTNLGARMTSYVEAMRKVASDFPGDNDVQTLFAEALMNTNPWKLWNVDGSPNPGTLEIVATLQRVLASDANHPGANHYLIHAVEASKNPETGLAAAEALKTMMPAAGHLVHMPSHIMQRVGRYEEAAEANRLGAAADVAYISRTAPPDYYPMYLVHNYQFLAFAAAMGGRSEEAISASRAAREAMPDSMLLAMPGLDWSVGYLYDALVRFGRWDEMLREPVPNPQLAGLSISFHQNRATALAATGNITEAERELDAARALIAASPPDAGQGMNIGRSLYEIGQRKAAARLASASGDPIAAIALLKDAAALEDGLSYNEPEDVFFPVRHLLGDALLKAGQSSDAESVFREDLARHPNNGWALNGLVQALRAQKREPEAEVIDGERQKAWANADREIALSAY